MIAAHNERNWVERNNYANAAGVDLVRYFYLSEEACFD
ncbi:conserved hypothetical protein [Vibrio phage 455E52-1]|nr:conserved hypothetical protein [Vibrio phage 455E52-1]